MIRSATICGENSIHPVGIINMRRRCKGIAEQYLRCIDPLGILLERRLQVCSQVRDQGLQVVSEMDFHSV